MKYGVCPACGVYGNMRDPEDTDVALKDRLVDFGFEGIYHKCQPKWMCTFGEEGEHDPHTIYAASAKDAAEKYAKWFDGKWSDDAFGENSDPAVVIVTDDREHSTEKGRVHRFNVSSEVVREYCATELKKEQDEIQSDTGSK